MTATVRESLSETFQLENQAESKEDAAPGGETAPSTVYWRIVPELTRGFYQFFRDSLCTHSQHRSIFGVGEKKSNSTWNNNKFFLQSLGLEISLVALDPFPITVIKYTHKSSPREEGAVSATAQCTVHHNRKVEAAGDGSSWSCIIWIRKQMNAGCCSGPFLLSLGSRILHRNGLAHHEDGLPITDERDPGKPQARLSSW